MNVQMCFPAKAATTLATQKRFFTAVRPGMNTQIVAGIESLMAHGAFEFTYRGVCFAMLLQDVCCRERTFA